MRTKVTVTLRKKGIPTPNQQAEKVSGWLTTEHPAAIGNAVFISLDGRLIFWDDIAALSTAAELGRLGGLSTSPLKARTSAENGRKNTGKKGEI